MDSLNTDQSQNSQQATGISDAIAQIKQWETAGQTEDAIEGCKEILEVDPENTEAKEILSRLETADTPTVEPATAEPETEQPTTEPVAENTDQPKAEPIAEETPVEPTTTPEAEQSSTDTFDLSAEPTQEKTPAEEPETEITEEATDEKTTTEETPTEKPETETATEESETEATEEESTEASTETNETPEDPPLYRIGGDSEEASETNETPMQAPTQPEKKKSHGFLLNIVLFLVVAGIVGGGIYAYLYFFQGEAPKEATTPSEIEREEIDIEGEIGTPAEEQQEEADTEASRNDQRFTDLTLIETKLEDYYSENRVYPAANELENALGDLPKDPLDEGEFMYSYAIYDNYLGENQEYILAGVFEDSVMGNTVWTTGASPSDHPDYRDPESENVVFITNQGETEPAEETVTEESEDTPKVKVKREE